MKRPEETAAQKSWDEKLKERERRILTEMREREEKIKLGQRLTKGYALLRLCRETQAKEG